MSRVKASPFVVDAAQEFMRTKLARKPKTVASYRAILVGSERGTKPPLGTAFAPFFQNQRVHKLTHDDVAVWFAQRVQGGAQDTKHRVSKAARAFLRFCRERGYTSLDLASAIDPYRPSKGRTDALEWSDVHALIDSISEFRLKMAVAWLFFTGCRVGEAVAARQRDVRRATNSGVYLWSIPDSKTDQPRIARLPDQLARYVDESRARNQLRSDWPMLWDCTGRGFARVEDPASPISAKTINSALERAAAKAGVLIPVTAHTAKHTYCTRWISEYGDSENSMERLSRQVGTSVAVLRRTYVHVHYTDADWEQIRSFGSR